jgi:hypothetical protein
MVWVFVQDWGICPHYEATEQHSNPEIGVEIRASSRKEFARALVT